jgi:hypothetical protein
MQRYKQMNTNTQPPESAQQSWKRNLPFLLFFTVMQAAATFIVFMLSWQIDLGDEQKPVPTSPVIAFLQSVLSWPFLSSLDWIVQRRHWQLDGSLVFLAFLFNGFIWAWALLKVKDLLRRRHQSSKII